MLVEPGIGESLVEPGIAIPGSTNDSPIPGSTNDYPIPGSTCDNCQDWPVTYNDQIDNNQFSLKAEGGDELFMLSHILC